MNEYIAALVDEFAQLGITYAVFSPGSRSTTMAMLFMEHGAFETYMNIDERSAGFMALGIAKAHRKPVILVCTSGSAVAHYMPAVLEAQYSGVPLIILSADRPHTLQHDFEDKRGKAPSYSKVLRNRSEKNDDQIRAGIK